MEKSELQSAAAFVEGGIQDSCDDACSICLDSYCENDPSTVLFINFEISNLFCLLLLLLLVLCLIVIVLFVVLGDLLQS